MFAYIDDRVGQGHMTLSTAELPPGFAGDMKLRVSTIADLLLHVDRGEARLMSSPPLTCLVSSDP